MIIAQWSNSILLDITSPCSGFFGSYGTFNDVDFMTETTGIYCMNCYYSPSSGSGIYMRSTLNAGNVWQSHYVDAALGINLEALYAVREQNTYFNIGSFFNTGAYQMSTVAKSTDNGVNWDYLLYNDSYIQDFSIIDTSHFFLLIRPYGSNFNITKYANGGFTPGVNNLNLVNPKLIFFTDTSIVYLAASTSQNLNCHLILKSVSAGSNWVQVFSDSLMNINKMFFTSANVGYAIGDSGKIIKTTDGGLYWTSLNTDTTLNLNSIFFINDSIGYVAGDSGLIIKTIDGGLSWHYQSTGTIGKFKKIFFVNDSTGFALNEKGSNWAVKNLHITHQNAAALGIWEPLYYEGNRHCITFPNPSNGRFNVTLDNEVSKIEILDLAGKVIYETQAKTNNFEINLSNLSKGIYFIRLFNYNNNIMTDKIIIE